MPVSKPVDTVDWTSTTGGSIAAPTGGLRTAGWATAQKVPAQNLNWFWNIVTQWVAWLSALNTQNNTWCDQTYLSTTSGNSAINATGLGAGNGGDFFGGTGGQGITALGGTGQNGATLTGGGSGGTGALIKGGGSGGLGADIRGGGGSGQGANIAGGAGGLGAAILAGSGNTQALQVTGSGTGTVADFSGGGIAATFEGGSGHDCIQATSAGVANAGTFTNTGGGGSCAVRAQCTGSGDICIDAGDAGGTDLAIFARCNGTHGSIACQAHTGAPSTPIAGEIYFDGGTHKHYGYDGSTWQAMY